MKLLFDQNLSRKLVTRIADIFHYSSHVQFHQLQDPLHQLNYAAIACYIPFINAQK
ncbi:DUF5615 family PIN-like protein [Anabaena sp. CCY 9402-a]|uniref:DUF5615 family PIN-like protein n=1 Tax=Anabaena sp. CCY 9402-a TaxID=3103867 RepID=UPI0039C6D20B